MSQRSARPLAASTRDLITISDLDLATINALLDRANGLVELFRHDTTKLSILQGRMVINLFFEPSTRTHVSFEIAAKRMGADVVTFPVASSSAAKGETLADTAAALDAMRPAALVVRHASADAPRFFAENVGCPVINAGNGAHEHPSQALLDALTILRAKGRIEGLTVAICGDIQHSRVAHSNMQLLPMLGAKVNVIAPPGLMPKDIAQRGVQPFEDLKEGLKGADIVMTLRIQRERMQGKFELSEADYFERYGLDERKLSYAKPDALVMDPGPVIRGVHISDNIVDGSRNLIRAQVECGVAMRGAILEALILGRSNRAPR